MLYFVPEVAVGHGLGHVHRDSVVAARLNPPGRVVVPPATDPEERAHRAAIANHVASLGAHLIEAVPEEATGTIVVDRRTVTRAEIEALPPGCTTVGIDTAGPARNLLDAVVDALPGLGRGAGPMGGGAHGGANEAGVFLPALPANRRTELPALPERILLAFGGEDPAGLTQLVLNGLLRRGLAAEGAVAVVQGPLNDRAPEGAGEVIRAPENLRELLAAYDLVIASYGLTAFEALAAGCRVILVNPTRYHEALARRARVPSARVRSAPVPSSGVAAAGGRSARGRGVRWGLLRRWLKEPGALDRALAQAARPAERELAAVLQDYAEADALGCPVCRRRRNPVIARLRRRSYFRCDDCGMVYLTGFDRDDTAYDEAYFFEEYRAQYGRTYLEDFEHIAAMGLRRLTVIDELLGREGRAVAPGDRGLLDVGCAYGPFLQAAAERGYQPFGIDPAAEAVAYVRSTLGYSAAVAAAGRGDPEELFGRRRFDAVTMWYVIEHIDDLETVLSWLADLVPMGGVFAFSTPNGDGVSARRDLLRFLARSPRDHRTIWTPAIAEGVLRQFGFRLQKVRITGHHPERYRLGEKLPWMRPLLLQWSRLRGRGDTFEAYAVRGTG